MKTMGIFRNLTQKRGSLKRMGYAVSNIDSGEKYIGERVVAVEKKGGNTNYPNG